ncbi:PEP-CTERM sorting domain-containing protein [Undibacterium sp.]|uniref:PEP-CTERM sorting domain-containing protein n=1 Tax=Undibacterium sp. TaxID=1914977 RepID=UPI00374CFB31
MIHRLLRFSFARHLIAASSAVLLCAALPASAAVIGFQSQAAFNAAASGWASTTTNFDSVPAGSTSYAAGTGPAGSGFTMTLGGSDAGSFVPAVGNQYWTTSGSNYLGLNNGDTAFEQGDTLTFNFTSAVRAFGFYVVGTEDVSAGDYSLTTGGSSVNNPDKAAAQTDGNGSFAYFLGFVADGVGEGFTSVSFSVADHGLRFNLPTSLDDIIVAAVPPDTGNPGTVPEPGSVALMLAGLLCFGAVQRRSRQ